jgi:hypothetical protein
MAHSAKRRARKAGKAGKAESSKLKAESEEVHKGEGRKAQGEKGRKSGKG